ncbi:MULTISPECIES: sugar phosphate isomerase/epimerase family protein [Geobacillus]|uniref:sugar phosphate isomerase/epimerase family protein n=1 Tax=Geobacillus TaxID=129337 RepID=UPI0009BE4331|nr:sugar phosphate isomerase/epimerase [Geobacillus zalihae]OQP13057.1 xylose isomerase [Geobacillus zalihae]
MKLGVFAVLFSQKKFEEALDAIVEQGVTYVEIGAGGYVGDAHCPASVLLQDHERLMRTKKALRDRGISVSALSVHGNPLHPNKEIAQAHHQAFVNAVKLANEFETDTIITFAGCPGDSEEAKYPNWVTATWPTDFREILEWQWKEKVVPYWQEQAEFCKRHGVKVAIEPHPGFVVYNTETAIRLRHSTGDNIGVNFDPSHLFWQQIDPVAAIKKLGEERMIYHVHAKDTTLDKQNIALNGVLDTKPYSQVSKRSWIFRTVGYGHGMEVWKEIISALQAINYDGVISIEHEDGLMSINEGLSKAVAFLKDIIILEKNDGMWWD